MCTNYKKKSVQTQKEQMGRLSDHWEWRKKISKKHFAYNGWPMHGNLLHILFIFFASFPFFSQQILIICDSLVRSLLSFLLQSIELLEPTRKKERL